MAFYDNRARNRAAASTDGEIDSTGRGKPQPREYSMTPNVPPPPGGGKVWDYTNGQWVDMPNLDPRRPWSRTPPGGSRTGDPNERFWHEPGSASGNWNPDYYHWDENGNWVPKPTGRYGMPEDRNGKPIFTPDPIKYPEYFVGGSGGPDSDAETAAMEARRRELMMSDPRVAAAMEALRGTSGSGREWANAMKERTAAMTALKQRMQEQRFIDQGGTAETWRNRFNTAWPVPKSPLGNSTHNPNGMPPQRQGPATSGPTGAPPATTQSPPPPVQVPQSMVQPPAPQQQAAGGDDPTGWRRNFKQSYVRHGGSPGSFDGDQSRINLDTFSYNKPVDRSLSPDDYRSMVGTRDEERKRMMGMPAKFLDPSRYNPNTRTYR